MEVYLPQDRTMTCAFCGDVAFRFMYWGPGEFPEGYPRQQANVCHEHMHVVWNALYLPARERVVLTAPR